MKNSIITFYCIVLTTISLFGQTPATKKVLLTLQPGEILQTNESCIELSFAASQLYVVTRKGDKIFVYEGGQRKGPFAMDAVKLKNCGESTNDPCAVYDPDQPNAIAEMVTYTESGGMAIKFKGKTYGPYKMVTDMHLSDDKNWFIAVAVQNGKFTVVSPDVPAQPIDVNASYLHVSPAGKKYMVVCKEGEGVDAEMMSMDMANMTQEKMMEMVQKQAEKKKNAGPPQAYVFSNGGKKFGPFPANEISENNPAFGKTSGENWYMVMDNALYINGLKVKQFSTDDISLSMCNIWVSTDGKRYAVVSYKQIIFSDGLSYPAPIKLDMEKKEGKTFLKWISLENEKDLVSYTKEL